MTTVHDVTAAEGGADDPTLRGDLAALCLALADHPFPTHQDELIAGCISRNDPSRLVRRLAGLSRTRTYDSVDAVLADVEAGAAQDLAPPR
ncbi:DUF2795 domain-containing protein [Phycicoccus sp. CSK15P-2]|uniref:DUF2795 domain-containing protein n=1 Tax=Phycicoccus sp. CSK15P-2 TaxID=2807627 RepID=UPI00194EB9AB|nr:DUF2795 domain-containing protein [Phycicoccus sp. CSK15P-2]MBM6406128.1 DUF2795 domain-containing protein [Phycicoccus sp. CSK15P-2]